MPAKKSLSVAYNCLHCLRDFKQEQEETTGNILSLISKTKFSCNTTRVFMWTCDDSSFEEYHKKNLWWISEGNNILSSSLSRQHSSCAQHKICYELFTSRTSSLWVSTKKVALIYFTQSFCKCLSRLSSFPCSGRCSTFINILYL